MAIFRKPFENKNQLVKNNESTTPFLNLNGKTCGGKHSFSELFFDLDVVA